MSTEMSAQEGATTVQARLGALRDLSLGTVHRRDTSYLGEQTEVKDMVAATSRQPPWPGFWYEILQGAYDYNDWEKGSPRLYIYCQGDRKPITLAEYARARIRSPVARVEVINYIDGESGLRPNNVVLTQHEAKSDTATLGVHGRGLKIATTATFGGRLAEKITFQSWVPEIGTWYGEAGLTKDPIDPKSPEYFQLRYKRDNELVTNQTVVTVHRPGPELLEALRELPEWFLPINPLYRFRTLNPEAGGEAVQNRLTIFASGRHISHENDAAFSPAELISMGHHGLENAKRVEPARVEILPKELFLHPAAKIDYAFVDGLRVSVEGASFSQIYAFWGFSEGGSGYNPRRSNDSLHMVGQVRDLVGEVLAKCTDPGVFSEILLSNIDESRSYEGDISSYDLGNIRRSSRAKTALAVAWQKVIATLEAPEDVYITSSHDAKRRADRAGKPTIYISSSSLARFLRENVPGVTSVDQIFETEDTQRREEIVKLQMQAVRREIEERERLEAAIIADRRARGIVEVAQGTGEILKLRPPEDPADGLETARLHLAHLMAVGHGRVLDTDETRLVVEMDADFMPELPSNTTELGDLAPLIHLLIPGLGSQVDLEIQVVKNGVGVYFKFSCAPKLDTRGSMTVAVQQGTLAKQAASLVRIEMVHS